MTLAELVAQLVLVAAGFSGLEPLPAERLPPLEALEPAALAAQACPMQPRQCQGIVAYFDTDRGRILLSSRLDLDDAGDNSFVVHELVHVLEWHHNGGRALQGCEASLRSERRAYRVQNAYLRQQGRRERHGQMLSGMACAPVQPSDQSMVLIPAASAYRERMVLEDFIADVEAGEAVRRSP
ncbi:MAG: hypothetical protein KA603_12170 [Azonexus sp.]|jgi:hypothetical protein|nr:hypothetical protein [Betaproteobacteria bacterium]MBK8917511.1 hypothetical protein [Betaproteobacteria bacterium]MBP6036880.1 hypothetical protein [Azonexus sp.]MBP6907415.1 hypothetical protein [Azonexus sp.]